MVEAKEYFGKIIEKTKLSVTMLIEIEEFPFQIHRTFYKDTIMFKYVNEFDLETVHAVKGYIMPVPTNMFLFKEEFEAINRVGYLLN